MVKTIPQGLAFAKQFGSKRRYLRSSAFICGFNFFGFNAPDDDTESCCFCRQPSGVLKTSKRPG
jgi:hypothetical protein